MATHFEWAIIFSRSFQAFSKCWWQIFRRNIFLGFPFIFTTCNWSLLSYNRPLLSLKIIRFRHELQAKLFAKVFSPFRQIELRKLFGKTCKDCDPARCRKFTCTTWKCFIYSHPVSVWFPSMLRVRCGLRRLCLRTRGFARICRNRRPPQTTIS
jgi:hypothetical protein